MIALPINLVLIPLLLMLAAFGVRRLAERAVPIGFLRFWLYPGVAVHELSHAAACIPAMSKVQSITIFRADGSGEVQHDAPRLGFLGQVMISLAPMAGGVLAMWLLSYALGYPLPFVTLSGDAAASYDFGLQILQYTWKDVLAACDLAVWARWQPWVLALAGFSVTMTMFPSGQDLKMAAKGVVLILLCVVAWLCFSHYVLGWSGGGIVGEVATRLLGFGHLVLFWFVIDLVLLLLFAGIGRAFGGGGGGGGKPEKAKGGEE